MDERFWSYLDQMVAEHEIAIDRPRASCHPRWPDLVYPLDYGYLVGTQSMDGGGIDLWRGSLGEGRLCGVIVTVDLGKNDSEIKLLVGCTRSEAETALYFHNTGPQAGYLIWRE